MNTNSTSFPSYSGYDHITWYVSNAKQAAQYYITKFGFKQIAYKGLETGSRTIAAHVVSNGNIKLVFQSSLRYLSENPDDQLILDEIHTHLAVSPRLNVGLQSMTNK